MKHYDCPMCGQFCVTDNNIIFECIACDMLYKPELDEEKEPSFLKSDNGKPQISYLGDFYGGLADVCRVASYGAAKYKRDNWKLCEDVNRYRDAIGRHVFALLSGEWLDSESNLPHAAHICWNALVLHWFNARGVK